MLRDLSGSAVFTGLLVAFVGFASSFAVILEGLTAVGASAAQAASGLMALSIAMGVAGIVLSLRERMPLSVAWSTPGAALLVTTGDVGGFGVAVGAFLICGAMLLLAGLWKPLGRAAAAIPAPLANAMLAGVLAGLCLAPFRAVAEMPALGLPILVAWVAGGTVNRMLAVPAALLAFVAAVAAGVEMPPGVLATLGEAAVPEAVMPVPSVSVAGTLGIALPLFIVTMASQNIPGIAVMQSNGYAVTPGPWFAVTGFFSLLAAPFGGHAVNMAAITAAMCAGEDAHRDPKRRYWAAVVAGMGYVALGLLSGAVTAFVALAPGVLVQAVAGLALIPAFSGAMVAAFERTETRDAAAVTFLAAASGLSLYGISGAFWGLLAGGAVMGLRRIRR